jgi:serine protease AprX
MRRTLVGCVMFGLALGASFAQASDWHAKVDPWVLDTAARGDTEFLVLLREQADLRGAAALSIKSEKGAFVRDALESTAERTQASLRQLLAARGVEHRAFWVANVIWVRGDARLVEELAARDDVFHVYANPTVHFAGPVDRASSEEAASPSGIEWNISKVHAPDVWALGYTGQGAVVAGEDTGYQWDHPAIKGKYRGWNGTVADHNYNWHDSIHSGGGSCGHDAPAPCDDTDHGTHTMGTMVGDDGGGNQIGMAPGAKWIGCRNMDQGNGTPATYTECFQWMIAPTDLANMNPDPSKAPHVINNSWGCPPSEGCTDPNVLKLVVENTRAAGIVVVVSAGNSGPGCSSVDTPAAIYNAAFSVGATDSGDIIADFSSRGAVTIDGSGRLKPDVSAPGVGVRSSVPGNGYAVFSGTSMAGPHVAGLVALLLSAAPGLAGNPDAIEPAVAVSCVPRTTGQNCNGVPGSAIPNNTYGWGRVDALAAANVADVEITQTDSPDPTLPGVSVTYTLTVTNLGPNSVNGVKVEDDFPQSSVFVSVTTSQGSCTHTALVANCTLGTLGVNAPVTVHVTVTRSSLGSMTNTGIVSSNGADPNLGNNTSQEGTTVVACPLPAPSITAPASVPSLTSGLTASAAIGSGHTATWTLTGGTITAGQGTDQIAFTSGDPGTTMLLAVVDSLAGCDSPGSSQPISVDFLDAPPSHPFHDYINTIARNAITVGCLDGKSFCPDDPNTRAQMAVFLLKSKFGASQVPPPCTGIFADVPCTPGVGFSDWIEQLANEGITGGCLTNPLRYCPDRGVRRDEMAAFLLKAEHGSAYAPPACTGIFADVPCTPGVGFSDWIERLSGEGITGGCYTDPLRYCPDRINSRGEMAVFLTLTFGLQ